MRLALTLALTLVTGCAAMSNPIVDENGVVLKNPDGTERTMFDALLENVAGVVGMVTMNPLLGVLVMAGGQAARSSVVKPKPAVA